MRQANFASRIFWLIFFWKKPANFFDLLFNFKKLAELFDFEIFKIFYYFKKLSVSILLIKMVQKAVSFELA